MNDKSMKQAEATVSVEQPKEYKEERFEFALYVNNNLVCKRNFKMYNFVEGSMQSEDFIKTVDQIVEMIDDDLKSKSRVYTWLYFDPEYPTEEFTEPKNDAWEHTFKFTITDNKREVYSKIWDGSRYPAMVRNNVDIANNVIKFTKRDGEVLVFDAEKYFEEFKDRLIPEAYVKKAMMGDKPNLLPIITKRICEACSPWNNSLYEKISDYNTHMTFGKGKDAVTYDLLIDRENKKRIKAWEKAVEEKTNAYFGKK